MKKPKQPVSGGSIAGEIRDPRKGARETEGGRVRRKISLKKEGRKLRN